MAHNVIALPTTPRGRTEPHARISEAYLSPLLSLSAWTVALVRAAIDQHEQGSFSASAGLADACLRDGRIFSGLQTRANALASRDGLPFSVEPNLGVDDRRARAVAATMERHWWTCIPTSEVSALQRDVIMGGVAVGRDDLQLIDGDWMPCLRRLRPHGLEYCDQDQAYYYTSRDGTRHHVTPGLNGWVLHAPHGGDSWMLGAIRPIGMLWLMRTLGHRDAARYSEKHGLPAIKIKEPQRHSDDVEGGAGNNGSKAFYSQIRRLGSEGLIRLPQSDHKDTPGWDAEWMELVAQTHQIFFDFVAELRREITAILLGRDPDTSTGVGGDGASLLERVRAEYLVSDANGLADTLRNQLWKPWVMRSVDPSRPELAGWPRWDVRPPADLAARATTLKTLGEGLEKLAGFGVEIGPLLEEFNLRRAK